MKLYTKNIMDMKAESINSNTGYSVPEGSTYTSSTYVYVTHGAPYIIDTVVKEDSIEVIYKQECYLTDNNLVYKIIYSCKDGEWNISDKIYGKIIEERIIEEHYEFNE